MVDAVCYVEHGCRGIGGSYCCCICFAVFLKGRWLLSFKRVVCTWVLILKMFSGGFLGVWRCFWCGSLGIGVGILGS